MKIELSRLLSKPFMAVNEEYEKEEEGFEIISDYGTLWRKL